MKHPRSAYESYGSFLDVATEIAKDKVSLYNYLIDPPTRKRTEGKGFLRVLKALQYILKKAGWYAFGLVCTLLAAGSWAFYGGMGSLIASNPALAAGLAIMGGGGGVYLLWKHRSVALAVEKVGKKYKSDFENIKKTIKSIEDREGKVNNLMKKVVQSICIEVFQIASDEFMREVRKDMKSS